MPPQREYYGAVLLGDTAEIAGDFPAARVLSVPHLIAAWWRERIDRDVAGFSRRRCDVQEHRRVGIARRRGVSQYPHQIKAQLVDDRTGCLRLRADFEAILER